MDIKVKVCGMRDSQNIEELLKLKPHMIGFIFYPNSKRYVGKDFNPLHLSEIPASIQTVGVFVNESLDHLLEMQQLYRFNYLQLHGEESAELCRQLKENGINVIKVFSVDSSFVLKSTEPYVEFCAYFLFDTKGPELGGNGTSFDWNVLDHYSPKIPFLLSGGIDIDSISGIKDLKNKNLYAIDINSRFETEPGHKNIEKVRELMERLSQL